MPSKRVTKRAKSVTKRAPKRAKRTTETTPARAETWAPQWDADKGPGDDLVNEAMRVLRAEYWASIRHMSADIVARVHNGEISRDSLSDAIHEECDECYWTIYTAASQRAVLASDHDWEETAEDMGMSDGKVTDAQRAYFVVSHDVTEQVDATLPEETDEHDDSDDTGKEDSAAATA